MRRPPFLALLLLVACADDVALEAASDGANSGFDATDAADLRQTDADGAHDADALHDLVGHDRDPDTSDAPPPLVAVAEGPEYAGVGEFVTLFGSSSSGAVLYQWDFGNGERWETPLDLPNGAVAYQEPGRYTAVLTVFDEAGSSRSDSWLVSVTDPVTFVPATSGTLAWHFKGGERIIAAAATGTDEVSLFTLDEGVPVPERGYAGCTGVRNVTGWGRYIAATCQDDDSVVFLDLFEEDFAPVHLGFGAGSAPYGLVSTGTRGVLYVTLAGAGELARVRLSDTEAPTLDGRVEGLFDARGVALLPDGRVAVTRWRSQESGGSIYVVDPTDWPKSEDVSIWALATDHRPSSDTESGGVPSYLDQIAVSPTGRVAALPSLQANLFEGTFRSASPLTHETSVRAIVSFVDISTGDEPPGARDLFDDRGFASSAVFSARGDFLFVTTRGSRTVERLDVLTGAQAGTVLDVGFAPDGLLISPDDRWIYVNASGSRELVAIDVSDFATAPIPAARLPLVSDEPLSDEQLRGLQLFGDSFDARISRDGYIACAHCHLDGESDNLVWDFTDRGEGLRNTIALNGRAGLSHGPLHWSANFDEVQDFEHDIRGPFRGTGLMTEEAFLSGTRNEPLGDPKAGASEALDALSAYLSSLDRFARSPFADDEASERGRLLFESVELGCTSCHSGTGLTDSAFDDGAPRLHDVGTLGEGSGGRLGGELAGIDTPTLHGLWNSAPYLHDGSAATLREVVTTRNPDDRHGVTSHLSEAEVDELVAFLRTLDGRDD